MNCITSSLLQLKSKNGVEFLIQYDTESIISDWHKVLMDTIRQLVSPFSWHHLKMIKIKPQKISSLLEIVLNPLNLTSGNSLAFWKICTFVLATVQVSSLFY